MAVSCIAIERLVWTVNYAGIHGVVLKGNLFFQSVIGVHMFPLCSSYFTIKKFGDFKLNLFFHVKVILPYNNCI